MPFEVDLHIVPRFKDQIDAKVDHEGLECGGTLTLNQSILKIPSLHKTSFVKTEIIGSTNLEFCQPKNPRLIHDAILLVLKCPRASLDLFFWLFS